MWSANSFFKKIFYALHIIFSVCMVGINIFMFWKNFGGSNDISYLSIIKMAAFGVFVLILIVVEILVLCKCSRSYKIDACLQFVAILLNLLIFQITFSNFSGLREVFFNKYSERVKKALWIVLSNLFLAPVVTQAICFLQEKNNIGLNIHLPKIVTGSYRTNFFISILAYTISIVLSVHYLKDKSNISLNVIAPVMVLISIITDQV